MDQKSKHTFEFPMKVRDYECDSQGIVNHANYLNYLENTRHEFLESLGVSFSVLHEHKIDPVVARVDIEYKSSLTGGQKFLSCLDVSRAGAKFVFSQKIYRAIDNALCVKAKVEVVVLENGKLSRGDYFVKLLKNIL